MKYVLPTLLIATAAMLAQDPQFTSDGQLQKPANYREWVFLSSGVGMTYGNATAQAEASPAFDNVFVEPSAYRAFLKAGKWPEKAMFVLEVRRSAAETKIGKSGRYQTQVIGVEAEVKDSKRFPGGGWGFFDVSNGPGKLLPQSAACYTCHSQNTAVENTFVQFYPTLLDVARAKGTLKPAFLAPEK
jgi:hypothetical protein